MMNDLLGLVAIAGVVVIALYLLWQHKKQPTVPIGTLLRNEASTVDDRVRELLRKAEPAVTEFRRDAAAALMPASPEFTKGVYFDRDDLMYAAGQHGVAEAIRIDGKPARSGTGPGLDFYTQTAGGFGTTKPTEVKA